MWNKFKEGFVEGFLSKVKFSSLVDVFIAIGVVYFFAWLFSEPADNIVGWVALGMAAGAGARQ
jgi:hypothetical protein